MTKTDRNYHLRRAATEDRRSAEADNPATMSAHRELAKLHRERAYAAPMLSLVDQPA